MVKIKSADLKLFRKVHPSYWEAELASRYSQFDEALQSIKKNGGKRQREHAQHGADRLAELRKHYENGDMYNAVLAALDAGIFWGAIQFENRSDAQARSCANLVQNSLKRADAAIDRLPAVKKAYLARLESAPATRRAPTRICKDIASQFDLDWQTIYNQLKAAKVI